MIAGFHQHKTQTRKPKPEQSPAARLTKPKTSLQLEPKLQIPRIIRISRILNHPVDDHCQHFLLARLVSASGCMPVSDPLLSDAHINLSETSIVQE